MGWGERGERGDKGGQRGWWVWWARRTHSHAHTPAWVPPQCAAVPGATTHTHAHAHSGQGGAADTVVVVGGYGGQGGGEPRLNFYSHITDTMQQQAAARIDREIAGADTPIPEPTATDKASDSEATDQPTEPKFEPYKGKIRKPGTGCVTMINDHLYEGRFSPRVNGKRIAKNIYATTREECEEKLKVLIAEMKKEIAEIKAGEKATNKG